MRCPRVHHCIAAWLEAKRRRIREVTWADYAEKAERYIVRPLGHLRLAELGPNQLLEYYSQLETRGLSGRTVHYVHLMLTQALQHAVSLEMIHMNPARQVRPSPYVRRPSARLLPEELARFLRAAHDDEFWPLWLLLATTGLRPSEALALHWEDLDLDRGIVLVERTLRMLSATDWRLYPLVHRGQRREIALPPTVCDVLRHRRAHGEGLVGSTMADGGLVFTGTHGKPLKWTHIARRHFKKVLQAASLPDVPAYSLRYSCVAELLRRGEDLETVARRTGYTSLARMLDARGSLARPSTPDGAESRGSTDPLSLSA